jgi:hypothetical protein
VDLRKLLPRLEKSTKRDIEPTDKKGEPELEQTTRVDGGANIIGRSQQFDVSPDGGFLINVEIEATALPITLLLNWGNAKPRPTGQRSAGHRATAASRLWVMYFLADPHLIKNE